MNNKTKVILHLLLLLVCRISFAQESTVRGKILDAKTKQPLISANVGIAGSPYGTITNITGSFELLVNQSLSTDTLFVSYVGYRTFRKKLSEIESESDLIVLLEEVSILLDEVTILANQKYQFEIKKLEASMKLIKDNLHAGEAEVTNEQYNQFLNYLIQSGQNSLYEKYKPDISGHEGTMLIFFKRYHIPYQESKESKYNNGYDEYPAVNITHEGALAFCEWLTEWYNNHTGKKKYREVRFRLPKLQEWQIAALGYKKFQSWNIEENEVEVGIPKIPGDMMPHRKIMMNVKEGDILYPWYGAHDYRNRAQNNKNCWMGNFKIPPESISCFISKPGSDGYLITGKVASYFPNGMGLYDVVGNVAEMIDEEGKACGGSWDDPPSESTIHSVKDYTKPNATVGFRIFMEVVEQ